MSIETVVFILSVIYLVTHTYQALRMGRLEKRIEELGKSEVDSDEE